MWNSRSSDGGRVEHLTVEHVIVEQLNRDAGTVEHVIVEQCHLGVGTIELSLVEEWNI